MINGVRVGSPLPSVRWRAEVSSLFCRVGPWLKPLCQNVRNYVILLRALRWRRRRFVAFCLLSPGKFRGIRHAQRRCLPANDRAPLSPRLALLRIHAHECAKQTECSDVLPAYPPWAHAFPPLPHIFSAHSETSDVINSPRVWLAALTMCLLRQKRASREGHPFRCNSLCRL